MRTGCACVYEGRHLQVHMEIRYQHQYQWFSTLGFQAESLNDIGRVHYSARLPSQPLPGILLSLHHCPPHPIPLPCKCYNYSICNHNQLFFNYCVCIYDEGCITHAYRSENNFWESVFSSYYGFWRLN